MMPKASHAFGSRSARQSLALQEHHSNIPIFQHSIIPCVIFSFIPDPRGGLIFQTTVSKYVAATRRAARRQADARP
jgi:hypothetical protein